MQAALKKICKSLQFSAFLPKNTELTIKKFRKKIRQRQINLRNPLDTCF